MNPKLKFTLNMASLWNKRLSFMKINIVDVMKLNLLNLIDDHIKQEVA